VKVCPCPGTNAVMKACEEFESLLEQRLCGALSSESAARLAAHLDGCAACRAFDESLNTDRAALQRIGGGVVEGGDWSKMRSRVTDLIRRDQVRMRWAFAMVPVIGVASWAFGHTLAPLRNDWMIALTISIAVTVFSFLALRRRVRNALGIAQLRGDLLAYFRFELDREIEGLRYATLGVVALGLVSAATFTYVALLAHEGRAWLGVIVILIVIAGTTCFNRAILSRRRRERADLDDDC
jgi:Putative zinc-finger